VCIEDNVTSLSDSVTFPKKKSLNEKPNSNPNPFLNLFFRRGIGGLPTRLIKGGRAGSVQSGSAGADAESLQDESSLDGEENDK
jgi:hypothetical protein